MSRLKIRRNDQNFGELSLTAGRAYFLGRKEDCDVVLQGDPGISRQHIKIEFADGYWTVQVLSQHIPITYEGKSLPVLICKLPVTHFYVAPYNFELQSDLQAYEKPVPVEDSRIPVETHPPWLPEEHAEPEALEEPVEEASSPPPAPPAPTTRAKKQEPAIDPEVSFNGNEDATNDVYQGDEPYLKFMYSTHTESIRLKGNKWVAGRDNIAQIQLDDKKASRQHFTIEKVGSEYYIKDMASANGTLLNGQDLPAHEVREIKSGDIITVNLLTIIFELRDLSFAEKLKDLPLQVYNGPMILTSQEWDMSGSGDTTLPADKLARLPGTVQRLPAPPNRLRQALLAIVAVVVVGGALLYNGNDRGPASSMDGQMRNFEALSKEDKKIVLDAYTAAQNFSREGHFQNALNRLAAIHKIIPFFKDSLELKTRFEEAQETVRQQEFIEQQRREQAKVLLKVKAIVADCRERFRDAVDAAAAKVCLSDALQLDPENSEAQSILAEVEMRFSAAQEAERLRKEFDDNVAKGRDLFYSAKNHFQNQNYQDAISAFSTHLNSNLPDPDGLRPKSQRGIASIEKMINSKKGKLMGRAQANVSVGNLRSAIAYAEQARRVDPTDYSIANFVEQATRDLQGQMRNLYTEASLEERFGNFELCKARWLEIIKKDIPNGVYYQKARSKLQQYGR